MVDALRARASDVDTSVRSRKEWAALYADADADRHAHTHTGHGTA